MNDLPLGVLLSAIAVLILLSAFFSGSETGIFSLNRYRLKHQSKHNKSALRVQKLLEKPEQLIGTILIGNNLVNNLAAALTTILAIRFFNGDSSGIAIGTLILTVIVLIVGEITPKTIAALHPEKIAYPASFILKGLVSIFYPLVWLLNQTAMPVLKLLGLSERKTTDDQLSPDELRTIVDEAGNLIPLRHQDMLLNILDLESATVEDIMIPRGEMYCIDINSSEDEILKLLKDCNFTRIPVYESHIDNIIGILHMRNLGKLLSSNTFSKEAFRSILQEPIFSPESTDLHMQLLNFQKDKRRISIVIDEYGAVLGLATLEDILEEIVGDFTSNLALAEEEFEVLSDGSLIITGSSSIRDINRHMNVQLPIRGPKTLNGLILEQLEAFPDGMACVKINRYKIEILDIDNNVIEKARIFQPRANKKH